MLTVSLVVLSGAVMLGFGLAVYHLRQAPRPPLMLRVAHGVAGSIGFALLLWALQGPTRGAARGMAGFGWDAAVLLGVALLGGIAIVVMLWARRHRGLDLVLILHGILAIIGYVILAAYAT